MSNAQVATTTVRLGATTASGTAAEFTASGTVVVFPGFLAALKEVTEDDNDDDRELPVMFEGMKVTPVSLDPAGHTTNPPARYTEAKLVAKLEELGIGRPSTYASIMSTIVDRGYVWKKGTALVPSFTAFAVVRLLEEHFGALVDYDFTKNLEEMLDLIANGEANRVEQLEAFWRGGHSVSGDFPGVKPLTEDLGAIDARGIATFPIEGTDICLRVGRYGAYVERGDERANVPIETAPDELTAELAEKLILEPSGERELGVNPDTGLMVIAKSGRFGPYVSESLPEGSPKSAKPRTGSFLQGMALSTATLDEALKILSLPRVVGSDPADGVNITVQNGRYGPYLLKDKDSRSLESEDQLFSLDLAQALALLAQPKQRGRNQPKGPLREVGADLATGLMITVREGRFGPYVTDGETNASLRSADDPMTVSLDRASDLIAERRIKDKENAGEPKPARTTAARKTAGKKATAKKSPAKKAAAKKSVAKKAPVKKAAVKKAAVKKAPAEPVTV
jgi:DNA topoisomerase-1